MKRYSAIIETIIGIIGLSFLIYILRDMLLFSKTTFPHDHIYWGYPVFQFFSENVVNGHYPLWNPFSHAGEPFYPILFHLKLLDPLPLLTIYLGQFFTHDCVMLYNWYHFLQNLIMALGIYIVLRPLAKHLFIRLSLIPILLYSSIMLGSFRQPGISYHFVWIPFITYFLLRIVYYKDNRWHNWLILAGLIGLNWQTYYFGSTWIFLLFFSLGFLFFRRDLLKRLFETKGITLKFVVTAFIILAMMMPSIVLMLERDKYVYPARMIDTSIYYTGTPPPTGGTIQYEGKISHAFVIKEPYSFMHFTGTFSQFWDFIQIISPEGNGFINWPRKNRWGITSEAYMYLGFLPWAIALLGLVLGRHELKGVWLLVLIGFGLLMLGRSGGLHRLLYQIYPPIWFIRHLHIFVLFFLFAFLYFYILGFNYIFSSWEDSFFPSNSKEEISQKRISKRKACKRRIRKGIAFVIFLGCIILLVYRMTRLVYPGTDYLFFYFILIFVVGWFLRNDLEKKGLYISLIISHIIIVLIFSSNKISFLMYLILSFGVPLILFLLARRLRYISKTASRYAIFVLFIVFTLSLTGDLIYSLKQSAFLYSQKHPTLTHSIKTTFHQAFLPQNRLITCLSSTPMRYLSLVLRHPSVFSTPLPLTYFDYSLPWKTKKQIEKLIEEFKANPFKFVLENKRWSSFLLLRKYFELVNSGISPSSLEKMFAVGEPMFQFKQGVVEIEEDKLVPFLRELGVDKSVQLFEEYVVADKGLDSSLNRFKISPADYKRMMQTASIGNHQYQENKKFPYSIKRYEYNSFDMETLTDKSGILYWADGYDENWHAYVNGKEVPISRANVNFKAIALPKGTNHIRFDYKHPLFIVALVLFYGSLIISTGTALIIRFTQKRKKGTPFKKGDAL